MYPPYTLLYTTSPHTFTLTFYLERGYFDLEFESQDGTVHTERNDFFDAYAPTPSRSGPRFTLGMGIDLHAYAVEYVTIKRAEDLGRWMGYTRSPHY